MKKALLIIVFLISVRFVSHTLDCVALGCDDLATVSNVVLQLEWTPWDAVL
jgi:hypothetical protein